MNKGLTLAILSSMLALSGCKEASLSDATIRDLGKKEIQAGFALHGYSIRVSDNITDRVYVLEKNGVIIAGTSSSQQVGKSINTVTTVVASDSAEKSVTNGPLLVCNSIEECQNKVADLVEKNESDERKKYLELKKRYLELKKEFEPN